MKKIIGIWEEFRNEGFSLKKEFTTIPPQKTKTKTKYNSKLIQYLKKGITLSRARTSSYCIFTGEYIWYPQDYTDGTWIWTSEFIYYVENYGLNVPNYFLNSIIEKNYIIPTEEELGDELLDNLFDQLFNFASKKSI